MLNKNLFLLFLLLFNSIIASDSDSESSTSSYSDSWDSLDGEGIGSPVFRSRSSSFPSIAPVTPHIPAIISSYTVSPTTATSPSITTPDNSTISTEYDSPFMRKPIVIFPLNKFNTYKFMEYSALTYNAICFVVNSYDLIDFVLSKRDNLFKMPINKILIKPLLLGGLCTGLLAESIRLTIKYDLAKDNQICSPSIYAYRSLPPLLIASWVTYWVITNRNNPDLSKTELLIASSLALSFALFNLLKGANLLCKSIFYVPENTVLQ